MSVSCNISSIFYFLLFSSFLVLLRDYTLFFLPFEYSKSIYFFRGIIFSSRKIEQIRELKQYLHTGLTNGQQWNQYWQKYRLNFCALWEIPCWVRDMKQIIQKLGIFALRLFWFLFYKSRTCVQGKENRRKSKKLREEKCEVVSIGRGEGIFGLCSGLFASNQTKFGRKS
jgi:hypothetical protein